MTKRLIRRWPRLTALSRFRQSVAGFAGQWPACAIVLLLTTFSSIAAAKPEVLTPDQFVRLFESNRVARAVILYDPQSLTVPEISGAYFKGDTGGASVLEKGSFVEVDFTTQIRLTKPFEQRLLASGVVTARRSARSWMEGVYRLLPFLVLGIVAGAIFVLVWVYGLGGDR